MKHIQYLLLLIFTPAENFTLKFTMHVEETKAPQIIKAMCTGTCCILLRDLLFICNYN